MIANNRLYTITHKNAYLFTTELVKNLEDVTDVVYTSNELSDVYGSGYDRVLVWHDYDYWCIASAAYTKMAEYCSVITNDKKKSVVIDDIELLELFTKYNVSLSTLAKGFRRIGNRLYPAKAKPTNTGVSRLECNRAVTELILNATRTLNNKHVFVIDMTYYTDDRKGAIEFLKHNVTAAELISTEWRGCRKELGLKIWDDFDKFYSQPKK